MLEDHWSFVCTCKRCQDPTELGTYASALRCFICGPSSKALVLPMPASSHIGKTKPPSEGSQGEEEGQTNLETMPGSNEHKVKWCCNTCDLELDRIQVEAILDTGLRIIKYVICNNNMYVGYK